MTKTVRVSGEWLAVCGKGDTYKDFDVIRTQSFPWAGRGFRKMFIVRDGEYEWTVAEARCECTHCHAPGVTSCNCDVR